MSSDFTLDVQAEVDRYRTEKNTRLAVNITGGVVAERLHRPKQEQTL